MESNVDIKNGWKKLQEEERFSEIKDEFDNCKGMAIITKSYDPSNPFYGNLFDIFSNILKNKILKLAKMIFSIEADGDEKINKFDTMLERCSVAKEGTILLQKFVMDNY